VKKVVDIKNPLCFYPIMDKRNNNLTKVAHLPKGGMSRRGLNLSISLLVVVSIILLIILSRGAGAG
jgi:hypothetical protein